jgi:large subunit ribosomal protein L29
MKTAEIRGMSDEQLALTIKDREKELFDLRFQSATNRLEAHAKIKQARRDLARLLTIQHERKLKVIHDQELAPLRQMTLEELAREKKKCINEFKELQMSDYRKKHAGRRHRRRIEQQLARIRIVTAEKREG